MGGLPAPGTVTYTGAAQVGWMEGWGGQKESQKNRFGAVDLRPTAAAPISVITHDRRTTEPYSTPSSALITPWSCVRITRGSLFFIVGGVAVRMALHFVLRPTEDSGMSNCLRWVSLTHTMRFHSHYRSVGTGHIYPGRVKSFPIQNDEPFLAVCRYVERNGRCR